MCNAAKIAVIGLGYVGLPLARLFSSKYETIGFDIDRTRIGALLSGHDGTGEVDDAELREALRSRRLILTDDIGRTAACDFYVIAVPTPVDASNRPDLTPLIRASELVGGVLGRGDVVVYESTVYPGVTEEECVPVLERVSGLRLNQDFGVGYSPERINPGDAAHRVENICKVTSGSDEQTAKRVDSVYASVIVAGTHRAPSVRVAEASKIVENVQRDVNIALMNELAKIFNAMNVDTDDVLEAAGTKWNFIRMKPGLVGGHCISVDPYYLIQKAQVYGILPRIMTDSRRLNDGMGDYVAQRVVRLMNLRGLLVRNARFLLLGFAFKENCPDVRNTKVADICHALRAYTDHIVVHDPVADAERVEREYGISLVSVPLEQLAGGFDVVIHCVAHDEYGRFAAERGMRGLLADADRGLVYDVKSVLPREQVDGRL